MYDKQQSLIDKGVNEMSKQHFEAIAGILKFNKADRSLCEELGLKFMDFNSNFDYGKFLTACGHGVK